MEMFAEVNGLILDSKRQWGGGTKLVFVAQTTDIKNCFAKFNLIAVEYLNLSRIQYS